MQLTSNYADLLDKLVRKVWDSSRAAPKEVMTRIYKDDTTDELVTKDTAVSGFGTAQELDEAGNIPLEDANQGYDVSYTQKAVGLGFNISKKLIKFERYNQIVKLPSKLSLAVTRKIEKDAAGLLNDGFATVTGGDSKELFSATHPLSGSTSTNSNIVTSNAVLAVSALDTLQTQMSAALDEKGELSPQDLTKVIIPPSLRATADVMMATMRVPGGSNNDANRWYDSIEIVVDAYCSTAGGGSNTAWFGIDDSINPLVWLWSQKPVLYKGEVDYDSKSIKYNTDAYYQLGHSDYRGVWGSDGTAS